MTGDEMEVIDPKTTGKKFIVGSDNKVIDQHDCQFAGDHSGGLNVDDKCTICGKSLGDFIAEDYDPSNPRVPIIISPKEDSNEYDKQR